MAAPAKTPVTPATVVPEAFLRDSHNLFEKARWKMGAIPAHLTIRDHEHTASICAMEVIIDSKHALAGDLPFVDDVSYHELGHAYLPWLAPGTFKAAVEDHLMVKKLLETMNVKWPKRRIPHFLNIVYDTIIDTERTWAYGCNPKVSLECQEKVNPQDLSKYTPGDDKIMEWLRAFREAVTETPFSSHICKEVQEAATKSPQIIRRVWDLRVRVKQICELLFPLFTQDFEDEQKDIEGLLRMLGVNPSGTSEGDDLDKMLEGIDLDDKELREVIEEEVGQRLGGKKLNWGFEKLWKDASKKVRFRLEMKQKGPGEQLRAGDQPWVPGMPLRELDVERTMERHGRFLPGLTTVRPMIVEGPGTLADAPQPQRMAVCVDVSGSMDKDPTSMALMTFLREAQRRQKPVAVDMFANDHVQIEFSTNYRKVGELAYEKYGHAGGGNSVPGPELIASRLRTGDLLLYITDFGLNEEDKVVAANTLRALKAKGVTVVFILMFTTGNIGNHNLPYVFCESIEALANVTLTSI